jgi:hypothetical protein
MWNELLQSTTKVIMDPFSAIIKNAKNIFEYTALGCNFYSSALVCADFNSLPNSRK